MADGPIMQPLWEEFERRLVPANATADQRRQVRIAFYAGGFNVFTAITMMAANKVPPEQMHRLGDELTRFIREGR